MEPRLQSDPPVEISSPDISSPDIASGDISAIAVPKLAEQQQRFSPAYSLLRQAIEQHAFPGCAFGMIADGKICLLDALGRFTYEDSPAVTPVTVYDIASITKVMATTAAAMLLHQRGTLNLDTPIGEILPGFVVGRDSSKLACKVTLRHLLAHNSGLPGYRELFRTAMTPAALYQACLSLPLEGESGTRTEYSDMGFILLGKALEMLAGDSLDGWVRHQILKPLGMGASGFCPPASTRMAIAPTEIDHDLRERILQGEVQDGNAFLLGGVAGHAGMFSNVPDLLRFSQAILGARPAREKASLFHAETVNLFAERQAPEGSSRALGWDTPSGESSAGRYFSPRSIGHLGFSGCSLWIDREAQLAIVLLTNRTWPDRAAEGIRSVRPAFHDALRTAVQL